MSLSSHEYLLHIQDEITYILGESANLSIGEFYADETRKRAFVRSIEIIGEAVKNLPDDLLEKYPQIEWRSIAGLRDRLIHAYFGIDYEIVWDVIQNHLPKLADVVNEILKQGDT